MIRKITFNKGLWRKVLQKKYLKYRTSIVDPLYMSPVGCSSTWRAIVFGANLLNNGLCWRVGNGRLINFWTSGPLTSKACSPSAIGSNFKLCDWWKNGEWDIPLLSTQFDEVLIQEIVKILVGLSGSGTDKLIWGATSNERFTVKSAYLALVTQDNYPLFPWASLWKLSLPPKLKYLFWLVCQRKLLTNVERVKRHLTSDPMCPLCHDRPKSMLHVLRDCSWAKAIWNNIYYLF